MTPGPQKQFDVEEALTQAMKVFWAHGYEAASMSELMAAMGIGKKSLYDTFGNKRELFIKCVNHYAQHSLGEMHAHLNQPGKRITHLKSLFAGYQQVKKGECKHGCFLGTNIADFDTSDKEIASILLKNVQLIESLFTDVLQKAMDAGEIRNDIPANDLARQLLCIVQGVALLSRVADCASIPVSTFESFFSLLQQ